MKLSIPLKTGEVYETEAEIVGDLALHPARLDALDLAMTHVPTLLSFRDAVPPAIAGTWTDSKARRKKLLGWMAEVQKSMPKDWLALRRITAESVRKDPDYSASLRTRIRNHCLATK